MPFLVIGRTVGPLVGGDREGDELINPVPCADDRALGTFNNHVGGGTIVAIHSVAALPRDKHFTRTVGNVGERPAQFTAPPKLMSERRLNVRHGETADGKSGYES